jgi:hypothetical protein
MPTQAQLIRSYRANVRRSKRWRSDNYDDDWERYIDLYRGKHIPTKSISDRLIVNLVFATINVMAPAVAVNNPKFVVNARKPGSAPQAIVTEEVLNYIWRTYRYQEEFRLSVLDWLITGTGWLKVGYKFNKPPVDRKAPDSSEDVSSETATGGDEDASAFGIDDREDVEGNVESEMNVMVDRPFLERISIFDVFVDPDARHPKEWQWIAQRTWRPVNDVKVDERYQNSARRKVNGSKWARNMIMDGDEDGRDDRNSLIQDTAYVEVIEYYDIRRRTVQTFALSGEDQDTQSAFLIKPRDMPYATGQPFVMLRNYEVPDCMYPLGDVCQIESLQLELNETRTQMMNHRKRFQRKWLYEKDAFDRDGIAALESDIDNTMIPVMSDGNPGSVIAPLPAVITPSDFYDQSALISSDIDRVSGVSDYQRGSGQQNMKRTATEAAMIQDAANSRAQDRLAKIETILAQVAERVIGLMQQFMTGEQVARIVTIPTRAWVNYDKDYIQGEFDYDVVAGSTEPQNETFRRQSAMQMVDASMPFLQMGVANPLGLYMYILQRGFGVKDVTQFVIPPQGGAPGQDPDAAQEGGESMNSPTQDPNDAPGQFPPGQVPQPPPPGGGMPPGMGGGPPQGIPPEMGGGPPQGIPPEMMQGPAPMPPGQVVAPPPQAARPEDIPPELLMQLLGSGGMLQ